jgi:hypothetical protein
MGKNKPPLQICTLHDIIAMDTYNTDLPHPWVLRYERLTTENPLRPDFEADTRHLTCQRAELTTDRRIWFPRVDISLTNNNCLFPIESRPLVKR